jgi:hypothetical protein
MRKPPNPIDIHVSSRVRMRRLIVDRHYDDGDPKRLLKSACMRRVVRKIWIVQDRLTIADFLFLGGQNFYIIFMFCCFHNPQQLGCCF